MLEPNEEYHDLATLVRSKAQKNGSRVALGFPGRKLTYLELDTLSEQVAAGLAAEGIGRGDRVAAFLVNRPEFPLLWFGLAKLGGVLVPLNTALKGDLLAYELADAQVRGMVTERGLWETFSQVRNRVSVPHVWMVDDPSGSMRAPEDTAPWSSLQDAPATGTSYVPQPADPASILYTSGTTGPPKGAIIPHEKCLTTPREIALRSRLRDDSVLFTALPLFHCNAQEMTMLTALLHDLRGEFTDRFHASTFWESTRSVEATHISLLIAMINVLFKQPEGPADREHSVRTALTAGTTRAVWPEFEHRFGVTIIELYGMTECGCTTLMNPPDAIRVGSVGTPLGFVEAEVVDDDDRPVANGVRGELVVRPRQPFTMFLGYHAKPEKTVEAWRNLWFHTGDFVTRDADGYYYFVDRKKDVIRRRGENVAPYDVETALNRHAAVFESVVVGVPSPLGEEDVKAFVQVKPGAAVSAEELFHFCIGELPFFMVPRYIEFVEEIPKTANQKAQRFRLRDRAGGIVHDREALGIKARPP